MYHQAAQISGTARQNRPSDPRTGRPNRKKDMQRQEQIRLLQLLVCLALFLTVFIGKGVFPDKMVQVRDNILTLISTDLDVREAFSQLGSSLTEQGSVLSGLEEFCVEVFGSGRTDDAQQAGQQVPELADVLEQELAFLSGNPSAQLQSAHYLYAGDETVKPDLAQREVPQPEAVEEAPQPVQEPAAIPAAGTVLVQSDYSGQPLPENYTMDQLSLGALDTVTPVVGAPELHLWLSGSPHQWQVSVPRRCRHRRSERRSDQCLCGRDSGICGGGRFLWALYAAGSRKRSQILLCSLQHNLRQEGGERDGGPENCRGWVLRSGHRPPSASGAEIQ